MKQSQASNVDIDKSNAVFITNFPYKKRGYSVL